MVGEVLNLDEYREFKWKKIIWQNYQRIFEGICHIYVQHLDSS
jgi:hypothetical protein